MFSFQVTNPAIVNATDKSNWAMQLQNPAHIFENANPYRARSTHYEQLLLGNTAELTEY